MQKFENLTLLDLHFIKENRKIADRLEELCEQDAQAVAENYPLPVPTQNEEEKTNLIHQMNALIRNWELRRGHQKE